VQQKHGAHQRDHLSGRVADTAGLRSVTTLIVTVAALRGTGLFAKAAKTLAVEGSSQRGTPSRAQR
jgi:hypothetical protein